MNKEKLKSSELVIIKKILAWQVAQVLGCEDEEELKKRALLLVVDYDEDSFFPLMTGDYFKIFFDGNVIQLWCEFYRRIADEYIEKENEFFSGGARCSDRIV